MQNRKIVPRKLAGFWELEPEKELLFETMLDKIKQVFLKYAFLPLDTPVMELSEILLAKSGGDIDKEIYRITKGSTDACLRYDFTVPLARYVAMNEGSLTFPFKRFQIGKVYRGERPQKGRYREFYQCDADIIGNEKLSMVADAECICLYKDIFASLGLKGVVEISSRKLLFSLVEDLGLKEKFNQIATILDKFDKIGEKEVSLLLQELDICEKSTNSLIGFVSIKGDFENIEKSLNFVSKSTAFKEALEQLKQLDQFLKSMNAENSYTFNMGIIRGHNYYTGTVFEAYLDGKRSLGAVGGGGRYDDLASYFSERKLPGVGMSIGISRLFDICLQNNLLDSSFTAKNKLSIIPLGDTLNQCLALCSQIRKEGIACDVMFEEKSFKSKLKDANRLGVPFVVIVGEDEVASGKFAVKNMETGEQKLLSKEELIKQMR